MPDSFSANAESTISAVRDTVDHPHDIQGLILSAPAARPKNVSAIRILLGRLLTNIAPNTGVAIIPYDKACSDPCIVEAQRTDPLTYQGPIRARMASQTLTAMKQVATGLPALSIPVNELLRPQHDRLTRPNAQASTHTPTNKIQ